ncbi:DUF3575 domain-containing protein [Bacteroides sp. 214]|uniref:DUF3575 domain-containing protein n=1 Tax=Bacteroides sp. 214 TaxID=2302935 RepID=UPI0013D80314|nr:DUF3575 domain-containing protein [Bacteroides sp. 214]NDW13119.1 DUF3575 domain-containing protein [Bacteroides sp. 214]
MKKFRIYTLLILCLLLTMPFSTFAGVSPTDSIYRRIILDGVLQQDFYFGYPQGSAVIFNHWGNNTYELDKLASFMDVVLGEKSVYIKEVHLSGHCSIEGSRFLNEELSYNRVKGFHNYLLNAYSALANHKICLNWLGEDWDKLMSLVSVSDIPSKKDVLEIINEVEDADERERKLMKLKNGTPYRIMLSELFPQLRRVEIAVVYDVPRMLRDDPGLMDDVLSLMEDDPHLQQQVAPVDTRHRAKNISTRVAVGYYADTLSVYQGKYPSRRYSSPLLAIKSNLLLWGGITAEVRHVAFTPNLSVEYFFNRHWSAEFEGKYAYWHYDNDRKFWGLSGYRLEARYWITLPNFRHIAYVGVYGRVGDYDIRSAEGAPQELFNGRNYTADYWDAGLSVGFYIPITSFLGLELGARGGYMSSKKALYSEEPPYAYLNKYEDYRKIMVTDLVVSLVFRIGR